MYGFAEGEGRNLRSVYRRHEKVHDAKWGIEGQRILVDYLQVEAIGISQISFASSSVMVFTLQLKSALFNLTIHVLQQTDLIKSSVFSVLIHGLWNISGHESLHALICAACSALCSLWMPPAVIEGWYVNFVPPSNCDAELHEWSGMSWCARTWSHTM